MEEPEPSPSLAKAIEPLFSPFQLGAVRLPNRIAMAPMTRGFAPEGVPAADTAAYYRRRALGGAGLIITAGAAPPHPLAQWRSDTPLFHSGAALAAWREVADAVHGAGSAIMVQLWHPGLARDPARSSLPDEPSIGPTGRLPGVDRVGRAMTVRDIEDVIESFGVAAETAERLGFDGVNIHAGHGYLIDEFFWAATNTRQDGFGGDIEGRVRFGVEIVREIRRRVSPGFPVSLRFSQWKEQDFKARLAETPQELERFLGPLAEAGVDLFDLSTRRFWLPEFAGSALNLAGWAKKLTGKHTMTVGSVSLEETTSPGEQRSGFSAVSPGNLMRLMEMFAAGDFDLVAVGRALLPNPDWPRAVREGRHEHLKPYDQAALSRLECAAGAEHRNE